MNKWNSIPLSEALLLQRGFDLPAGDRDSSGNIPVVASTSIVGYHSERAAVGPGVVIGRSGSIGGAQWVEGDYWPLNTTLWLKDTKGNDKKFLYYLLKSIDFSHLNVGSGVPTLNRNHLSSIQVRLPPLEEQRRISWALSNFDALIQLNERLVNNLLEVVAVEFSNNFGSSPVEMPLAEIATVIDCLHSKKPARTKEGKLLLQLNNIRDDGMLLLSEQYLISVSDYEKWSSKFETQAWDCVITNVGRVGAVSRIPNGVAAALGRNMTALRPDNASNDGPFMAAALFDSRVRADIANRVDSGTILDALNVKNIPQIQLPRASNNERASFSRFAGQLFTLADELINENTRLASSREQLLPKLISGEIRVADSGVIA